jgi:hypothetical protein
MKRARTLTHDPPIEADVTEDRAVILQCACSTLSGAKLLARVTAYNGTGFYTGSRDLMNPRQCASFATPAAAAYREACPDAPELPAAAFLGRLQELALVLQDLHDRPGKAPEEDEDASDNAKDVLSLRVPGMVCVAESDTGGTVFVMLEDGDLSVVESVLEPAPDEHQQGTRYLPPPQLPWNLPRASEVVRHWDELQDAPPRGSASYWPTWKRGTWLRPTLAAERRT